MKEFRNIFEAINYHTSCYRCGSRLHVAFHGDPVDIKVFNQNPFIEVNLSANMDSDTDDILTINTINNQMELNSINRINHDYIIGTDLQDRSYPFHKVRPYYGGTTFESLQISCRKCNQFKYIIQILLNIEQSYIENIFLNSEHIYWTKEDNKENYEIDNIYATKQTKFYRQKYGEVKQDHISIPLIPLNLKDPEETATRIKKLAVYL